MSAFGGDSLQRKAMSHKSSFIIIDIPTLTLVFMSLKLKFEITKINKLVSYRKTGVYEETLREREREREREIQREGRERKRERGKNISHRIYNTR